MPAALVIADSGPLIALARLDLLALPARLSWHVLVGATVWHEVTRAPRGSELQALEAARRDKAVEVVEDTAEAEPLSALADARLDAGERSALALAIAHQATVLMDERRGRACAATLGLQVVGTLGVLVRSRELGLVAQLRPLLDRLIDSGYHIAPGLVERALSTVGE
jgi:predicted nucleic acid-binding protein